MPIYEYQCRGCCHCFEILLLSSNDPDPKCPECQCADIEKLMSVSCARPHGIPSGSGGFEPPSCKPSG
jgi:putative FmdB family regulatory protein